MKIRIVLGQSLLRVHLEAAILHSQVHAMDSIVFFGEENIAEIEPSSAALERDKSKRWLRGTIDSPIGRWLVIGESFDEAVEVTRIGPAQLIS